MNPILIRNGKVIADGKILKKDIFLSEGKITDADFYGEAPQNAVVIDANGKYVAPGFVEIHAHGGGGADMMDCTKEAFQTVSYTHLKDGTTTLLPTTVSASFEDTKKVVEAYHRYAADCPNFAGLHFEGPYLAAAAKGAHKEKFLHTPTPEETEFILSEGHGIVARITAAAELDGIFKFSENMAANGILMSLGHSDADCETALQAFQHGFTHITHFYNMTPAWRKRGQVVTAGIAEAGYLNSDVTLELIGDGKHVAAECGRLAVKIKGTDHVALISDALRPAGLNVTESYIGEIIPENRVIIEDGVAKLPDRSFFAGSIATGAMLLKRGVEYFGFSIVDTVRMLSETPADIIHRKDIGRIQRDYTADIVIFDESLAITEVICKGNRVNR